MVIKTNKLGLAAYVQLQGMKLVKVSAGAFYFESEKDIRHFEVQYLNSCCHKHDSNVMSLRNLLPGGE